MPKTSMEVHPVFPHLPAKCGTRSDPKCAGCSQIGNHPTAAEFFAREPATADELFDGSQMDRLMYQIWRKNFDAEGMKSIPGDQWYPYNGRDTVNYAYAKTMTVTAVDGKEITLTALPGEDARECLRNIYRLPSPDDGTGLVKIDYYTLGSVQPLAVGVFSANSVAALRAQPVIVKILSSSATTLVVETDKAVDFALTKIDPGDTDDVTLAIWQYASPEVWQFINQPSYFYGARRTREWAAEDLPGDGIVTLNDTVPVAHPAGFDPLTPNWVLEGLRIDTSEWETVPQEDERLFVTPDSGKVSFKTTKPLTAIPATTLTDDLTATYSRFRAVWYDLTDGSVAGCSPVAYSRCKYSLRDPSGSMGTGYTGDGIGAGFYCLKKLIQGWTLTDEETFGDPMGGPDGIRDTATADNSEPSGLSRFPANGLCLQHGSCDSWSPAEGDVSRTTGPFQFAQHAGIITRELTGATNHRRYQPTPGIDTWQIERILHPSICQLAGWVFPETETGQHPQARFSGIGTWSKWRVETDGSGNESILLLPGPFESYDSADPDAGGDGLFPAISGWGTVRDPLDATATISLRDMDRIGVGFERDTGELKGPGVSQRSFATAAQDLVVAANVQTTLMDTVQNCTNGSFKRVTGGPSEVKVIPLRQELKTVETLNTRTVHSVTTVGGYIEIRLKNVPHTRMTPVPLMGYDDGPTWYAGGGAPIYPPTHRELVNYYEPDKTTGSALRGVWRGDGIQTAAGRLLVIAEAEAFGGPAAADWGGSTPDDTWSIDQVYTSYGKNMDVVRVLDDAQGTAAGLSEDDEITFIRSAVVMLPGGVLEWTEYGTDNWQPVSGAVCWYGEGLFEIPDVWFGDKPENICFRILGCEWMDHRGHVPGKLINDLQAMVDKLEWLNTAMGSGGGTYSFGKQAFVLWEFVVDGGGCVADTPVITDSGTSTGFTGNQVIIEKGATAGPGAHNKYNQVTVSFSSLSAFGLPEPLKRVPDGATIVEAWAEISSSGLTRSYTHNFTPLYDCAFNEIDPGSTESSTDLENISFTVIGFTAEDEWETIGSVTGAIDTNKVVNITTVLQAMLENADSFQFGFGLIYLPDGYEGDITGLIPPDPPASVTLAGDCRPCGEDHLFVEYEKTHLTWTGLGFGQLEIKIQYPNEDKSRRLLMPMWPSMKPV